MYSGAGRSWERMPKQINWNLDSIKVELRGDSYLLQETVLSLFVNKYIGSLSVSSFHSRNCKRNC